MTAMDEERFERLRKRFEGEAVPWIERRTIPIFKLADGGSPTPEGTGVLLQVADRYFVVTAAHALDVWGELALIAPLGDDTGVVLTACKAEVTCDRDQADFALIPLSQEMADVLLKSKAFVRMSETDVATQARPGIHAVFGYPLELSKVLANGRLSDALFYPSNLIALSDVDPGLSIAMEIHSEIVDSDGDRSRLPDLHGISGCGIWRLTIEGSDTDRWTIDDIRLVGIEHTVRPNCWIRGARIRHVLAGIASRFPELERCVSLTGITLIKP